MAGLQRFITYMNQYENDEKQANAGFAKIEIRGSVCRVEVHIRTVNTDPINATVYLFAVKAEIIQGIPVGSMELGSGGGDVRFGFDIKEIKKFGLSMSDMEGIYIPLNKNSYLASRWKEGTVSGKTFQILSEQEAFRENPPASAPHPQQEKSQSEQPSIPAFEQQNTDTSKASSQNSQAALDPLQPSANTTASDDSAVQNNPETIPQSAPGSLQVEPQEKRNLHATELPLEHFREEAGWDRIFGRLRLKLGVCFPFEGQEVECIRLNLNDLREFPQKYWYLGKNSFLLHGFFNYRHILLGQTEERGKKEYFLGIPGVFQNQERLMASMFGFPGFRTAKAAEYKTGNFGYWYRII